MHDGNRPELRPLDLGQEALPTDAAHTGLPVVLAALSSSADQFLGGGHRSLSSHTLRCFGIASELALARFPVDYLGWLA